MTIKFHPSLKHYIYLGVIVILLFLLYQGCQRSKNQLAVKDQLELKNIQLQHDLNTQQRANDSSKKEYEDSLEFVNGQYDLIKNQKERAEDNLDAALSENKKLIAKYKSGNYIDTATIPVPHEFVADCHDCFNRLETTSGLVDSYKEKVRASDSISAAKEKIYKSRINQQDQEKFALAKTLHDCIAVGKDAASKLEQRRKILFSWSVLSNPFPCATGIGALYQDKRNRQFGFKKYFGNLPSNAKMWEAEVNLPLSFKRK